MANYEVDPSILAPLVPKHTELDLFGGKCLVSLVAFQFRNTHVKGFRIPWHVNFPEINLRFYLKRTHENKLRRGVSFIAEIVPRHAITLVANTLFNENYKTRRMSERVMVSDLMKAEYKFVEKGHTQTLACSADTEPRILKPGSLEEFITEHYYGYTKGKHTLEYQVEHPQWRTFQVRDYKIDVDFASVYGDEWGFLKGRVPHSVLLAEGSAVNVYAAQKLVYKP